MLTPVSSAAGTPPRKHGRSSVKAAREELKLAAKREATLMKMSSNKEAAIAKFVEKWTKQQLSKMEKSLKPKKRRVKRKKS